MLSFDLRGHGSNRRGVLNDDDGEMVDDLQSVYQLMSTGTIAASSTSPSSASWPWWRGPTRPPAWAYQPGGAVSSEGRVTDLSALRRFPRPPASATRSPPS